MKGFERCLCCKNSIKRMLALRAPAPGLQISHRIGIFLSYSAAQQLHMLAVLGPS